jgi:hypothetical protein
MQLNQPIPPSYSGGDGQFDFILNGNQKPKKSLIPLPQGNSRKQRLLVIFGGVVALIFILALVFGLLLNSGSSTKDLVEITKTQTEIVRVAENNAPKARGVTARNFSETVALTMTSSKQQTISYLAAKKTTVKPKELALGLNAKTDADLKSADAAGRYDEELLTILEKSLADYRTQINTAYNKTSVKSQKQLLQQLFEQVTTLTKNQPDTSS